MGGSHYEFKLISKVWKALVRAAFQSSQKELQEYMALSHFFTTIKKSLFQRWRRAALDLKREHRHTHKLRTASNAKRRIDMRTLRNHFTAWCLTSLRRRHGARVLYVICASKLRERVLRYFSHWKAFVIAGAVLDARDELAKVHEKLLLQKAAYEKMKHEFHTT